MRYRSCSFCGKREDEVEHLVLAKSAGICDECITVCAEVNRRGVADRSSVLLTGIGELVTNDRLHPAPLGRVADAAVAIVEGVVRWLGPADDIPPKMLTLPTVDCGGRAVVPGFVDAAALVVFGGEQSATFAAARNRGDVRLDPSYTAAATGATRIDRLQEEAAQRLVRMLASGTTAADARTGHGLEAALEAQLLDTVQQLSDVGPALIPTLRIRGGSHSLDELLTELLAVCAPRARFLELDADVLRPGDIKDLASEGRRLGLGVRLAGSDIDGPLVEQLDPISVDNPDPALAGVLREGRSVAVLIPAATYGGPAVDGSALAESGIAVAVATGTDPNTMYVENMQLAIALSTVECRLTVDEALWAATRGGALAIDDERRGWIGRGAVGDVVVIDGPAASRLAYQVGSNLAWRVYRAGRRVD